MLWSQIRILQKFGVTSVIMPYFDFAHKSFLLLSQLNHGSRSMLNEFYSELINCLFQWAMSISTGDHDWNVMLLPSNLFKLRIDLKNENIIQQFIEFIEMIHHRKGYYFNSHYMHEQLWITSLHISWNYIQKLVPYFDILKPMKLVNKKSWTSADVECDNSYLIDKFMIQDFDFIVDKQMKLNKTKAIKFNLNSN